MPTMTSALPFPLPAPSAPDTERTPRSLPANDGAPSTVVPDAEAARIRESLYRTDDALRATVIPEHRARLAPEDLTRFRDDGYLALEGVLSPADVVASLGALRDLVLDRVRYSGVWVQQEPFFSGGGEDARAADPELRVRKLAYFVKAEPRLAAMAAHPRLSAILDQLIGARHRLIQDMALLKPPFKGSEKPWHQDNAYFDWTPLDGVIGVWIALDEATVENGCMQIVPGSHRAGPSPHYHVRDCQLPDDRIAREDIHVVPLKPGGALFFSALLHHGTPANLSAQRRRALQFHYTSALCRRMTFEEHMAYFRDGAFYAGCRDWDMETGVSRAILEA
jgi:phytanoyl-CoA hydroxylase